jgi:hypothetical protein
MQIEVRMDGSERHDRGLPEYDVEPGPGKMVTSTRGDVINEHKFNTFFSICSCTGWPFMLPVES